MNTAAAGSPVASRCSNARSTLRREQGRDRHSLGTWTPDGTGSEQQHHRRALSRETVISVPFDRAQRHRDRGRER